MGIDDIPRVIPILLIEKGKLVKTISFASPAYLGDPINTVRIFNQKEADELLVIDISATRDSLAPDFALLERLASEAFMPLTYGGGIRSADDAAKVLSLGFEKVAVESLLLSNPDEVRVASDWFGAQAILGVITTSGFESTIRLRWGATEDTIENRLALLRETGVGEVLHYDSDRDGTRNGYNLPFLREVASQLTVPLIAAGGAGEISHFPQAIEAGASAVAAGSLFSQHGKRLATLISYPTREDLFTVFGG
jgi:cyclase